MTKAGYILLLSSETKQSLTWLACLIANDLGSIPYYKETFKDANYKHHTSSLLKDISIVQTEFACLIQIFEVFGLMQIKYYRVIVNLTIQLSLGSFPVINWMGLQ